MKTLITTILTILLIWSLPALAQETEDITPTYNWVEMPDQNPFPPPTMTGGFGNHPQIIDFDGDGDFDAFDSRYYYENIGTKKEPKFKTPPIAIVDQFFGDAKSSDSENFFYFRFVDIDNDGDWDAFVKSKSIKYYENTGTPNAPVFEERIGTANPLASMRVGNHGEDEENFDIVSNAFFNFVDIDADQDLDLFVGNQYVYPIQYHENIGDSSHPQFEEQTDSVNNPFNGVESNKLPYMPSFADIDQDGDLDVFMYNQTTLFYHENIGTAKQPQFEQRSTNPLNDIVQSRWSKYPVDLKDIDNDNDLDVFMGRFGRSPLIGYENIGSIDNPIFVEESLFNEPHTVDMGWRAVIRFVDIDNDGDQDVFMGSTSNISHFYENIGNARSPKFVKRTHTENRLPIFSDVYKTDNSILSLSSLIFVDIDNDGDWDAFTNDISDDISYYENIGRASYPQFIKNLDNPLGDLKSSLYIDNFSMVDIDHDGDMDVFYPRANEPIMYLENIGSPNDPVFAKYTGNTNPLDGITPLDYASSLNFVDVDWDGDWDAVFKDGRFYHYYENTGSSRSPVFERRTNQNNPFLVFQSDRVGSLDFVDLNNDGYLEAFIGLGDGTFKYYQNISQRPNNNQYIFKKSSDNPLGLVPFGDNINQISFVDLNNDHDWDAFINYATGYFSYYENIGDGHNPRFIGEFQNEVIQNINATSNVNVKDILVVNLDQDEKLEMIRHDTINDELLYYENVGDAKQPHFEILRPNPFKEIDVYSASQFYFVDIDNDQDLDFFAGEDGIAFQEKQSEIMYFENIGLSHLPSFEKRLGAANPLSKVEGSYPCLVDIDHDGDRDAFIVFIDDYFSGRQKIRYFENTGNPNQPQFEERTGTANPLANIKQDSELVPAFVDLEGDGDWDVFMGYSGGTLPYYENTGTPTIPQFVERVDHPLDWVNMDFSVKPHFADFDQDGDWDIFVGHRTNNPKYYYENTGNATHPVFQQPPPSNNSLSKAGIRGTYHIDFVDIDNDTDQDVFIADTEDNIVRYYENMGNINTPKFVERTDTFTTLIGDNPSFVDIDNDQDLDAVILEYQESYRYYENIGQIDQPQFVESSDTIFPPVDFPNISHSWSFQFMDGDSDQDWDAMIVRENSEFLYYENIGQADNPKFIKNDTTNLFKEPGQNTSLKAFSLIDIDMDGDQDMFLTTRDGMMYYINTSAKGHTLADYYALPSGGRYAQGREINLGCFDCTQIYYTLDGSQPTTQSPVFAAPFNITETTTLKFFTVDAQSNASEVITEQYLIDTQPPVFTITWPINNQVLLDIGRIEGTVQEPGGGTGVDHLELQIHNGPLYLTGDNEEPFTRSPVWIKFPLLTLNEKWIYDFGDLQLPVGPYTITVRAYDFAGNYTEKTLTIVKVEQAISDLFLELSSATLLNDATLNAKGNLVSRRFPAVPENLAGLPIELTITAPDGSTETRTTNILSDIGQYEFKDLSDFTIEGAYTLQTRFAGNRLLTESVSSQQTVLVGESAGYAIIIQGRIENEEGLESHNKTTNRIYQILKKRGFEDANIFYFNPNPEQEGVEIDGPPTVADFVTIEEMQHRINGSPAPFYLIMVDHGDKKGNFYINDTELEAVTPEIWAGWLEALETGLNDLTKPRIIILGYCYSGKTLEAISKPGRIVISSATAKEESYKGPSEPDGVRSGEFFMEAFFKNLGRGESLYTAFEEASAKTKEFTTRTGRFVNVENEFGDDAVQHPLIEINGDQKGNNKAVLEYQVEEAKAPFNITEIFLGAGADYDTNYAGNPADIVSVAETIYLTPEESATTLSLTVNNQVHRIKEAAVNVRLPSTELTLPDADSTGYAEQREITELVEINLLCDFSQQCQRNTDEVTPNLFTEPGKYNLYYFVVDNETDNMSPIHHAVIYKGKADNQLPPSFTLLTPENHTKTPTTPTFTWQPTPHPDKDAITYTHTNAEDSDFNTIAYQQEGLRKPEYALEDETVLKDNTTYYWKVEAVDYFGGRVESGEVFSISTKAEQ
jgi:hypothetical protein